MHQAGVIAALRQHLCHNVFLADMRLGDVLDRDPCRSCEGYGTLPYAIPQRHCELRVVEDADPTGVEKPRHALGIADTGQRPGDHHPVVARQDPSYLPTVALDQRLAHTSPRHPGGRLLEAYWFRLCRLRESGADVVHFTEGETSKRAIASAR